MKVKLQKGSYKDEENNGKEVKYLYIETLCYGFWLRFCHEHFIPCEKCQNELDEMMNGTKEVESSWVTQWVFDSNVPIELFFTSTMVKFTLNFLCSGTIANSYRQDYELCKSCVETFITKIMNTDELHIGSEIKPPVELWRKWMTDDKRTERLMAMEEKVKAAGIHLNSFYANLRVKKTTKEVDKYFDNLHKNLPYYSPIPITELDLDNDRKTLMV